MMKLPPLDKDESDIYLMDGPTDFEYEDDDASDASLDMTQEIMHSDQDVAMDAYKGYDHQQQQHQQQEQQQHPQPQAQAQARRPPPIATEWDNSISVDNFDEKNDDGIQHDTHETMPTHPTTSPHVTFNIPNHNSITMNAALSTTSSSTNYNNNNNNKNNYNHMMHSNYPHAKRYNPDQYPSQKLARNNRSSNNGNHEQSAADAALEQVIQQSFRNPRMYDEQTPNNNNNNNNPTREKRRMMEDVTPAFLRRAAQDTIGAVRAQTTAQTGSNVNYNPPPPNSLMMRREKGNAGVLLASSLSTHTEPTNNSNNNSNNSNNHNNNNHMETSSIPDSSFYGADASALDGTFCSIRDLNDDDDVPSVDNEQDVYGAAKYSQWNPTNEKGDSASNNGTATRTEAQFPTETTSLLGTKKLNWQGGFFGNEVEKEDKRERLRMMRAKKGWVEGWLLSVRSAWRGEKGNGWGFETASSTRAYSKEGRGRDVWLANHPIGGDYAAHASSTDGHFGGLARQRGFSLFLMGVLCFHMALCVLHDLFLRYLSYRHPEEDGAGVSWNGEGRYIPAYWMSFEGRVLNPCFGPGARTLTAFGALVPGIVLSKGQAWRIGVAIFQSSSFLQLILHIWVLKAAVGGYVTGLEWRRGSFAVASLYLIIALLGSAWSIASEPGRLITASGMGMTGLLAAVIVEQWFSQADSKDDNEDDNLGIGTHHNDLGGGTNVVSAAENEQFTFQPPSARRKKRRFTLNLGSPFLLLTLEIIISWWEAYASLTGTVAAAIAGASFAALLFVGDGSTDLDRYAGQDNLLSAETPPPPPSFADRGMLGDDDDSADTSIGASRQAFNTPLMRKSILADEDEEDEPLGTKSLLRRRKIDGNGSTVKTPGLKGRYISINNSKHKVPLSPGIVIARVVGILMALLLTLIPASLIASMDDPSNEMTRASVLGCKPMRVVYREDGSDFFECAGGCIPLSRTRVAKKSEGMRDGRCDSIGYRCWSQAGTMNLRNYELDVGIYNVPSSDGSCGNPSDDEQNGEGSKNNDDAYVDASDAANGEVEGVQ